MAEYGWDQDMRVSMMEKLKADLKSAMLAKDVDGKNTIRQVMSEFYKLTVPITLESGKKTTRPKKDEEITDDDLISLIQGLVKSEKMVLEMKKEATSPYLEILTRYLPAMVDKEAIAAWVADNVDLSQFKTPMQAMGPIMKHFGKTVDGNDVKAVLSALSKG
nr:GatB/YqeY domain-containing protein [Desulfobulbaceae bacterium]